MARADQLEDTPLWLNDWTTEIAGYRRCRKCSYLHPKALRGCPTEELAKDIYDMNQLKDVPEARKLMFEDGIDERIGYFLVGVIPQKSEPVPNHLPVNYPAMLAHALNVAAARLNIKTEWLAAKWEAINPNRKRLTITPEGDDDVRT